MTDITTYPLEDSFETTLSQAWDGAAGTINVNAVPSFTFGGNTTYITVNPGKSNMQVAEINAYDGSALTITVSSTTVNSGSGDAYSETAHAVGSTVIISDNFAFREDIITAINARLADTNDTFTGTLTGAGAAARLDCSGALLGFSLPNLTTAQRNALTPENGDLVYDTTLGDVYSYQSGSWAVLDTGTATPNASTTVAGVVELATQAELDAGTATGGTGASLSATPPIIADGIQKSNFIYAADAQASDTYVITLVPAITDYTTGQKFRFYAKTVNTGACTLNVNAKGAKSIKNKDGNDPEDGFIKAGEIVEVVYDGTNMVLQTPKQGTSAIKGILELATLAEAITGTSTSLAVTPAGAVAASRGGDYDEEYVVQWYGTDEDDLDPGNPALDNRGTYMYVSAGAANSGMASGLLKAGNAGFAQFDDIATIEIETYVLGVTGDTESCISLTSTEEGIYLNTSTDDGIRLEFATSDTTATLYSADGATSSNSGAVTVDATTSWNKIKVVLDVGTDIKFYHNGTLKDTHTTNLPNSGDVYLGIGIKTDTDICSVGPITVKIKRA